MDTKVEQAIKTLFDSASLDSASNFPGGIWADEAPSHLLAKTAWNDYVVVTDLGKTPDLYSTHSEAREEAFQFSIFLKADQTTDPKVAIGTKMSTLDGTFHHGSLPLASSDGQILYMRHTTSRSFKDPAHDDVWVGQIDYAVRRRVGV